MNKRKRISRENQEMFPQKRSGERFTFLTKGKEKKKRWVREQRRKKKGKLNLVKLHANREGTNKSPNKLNVVEIKLTQ